MSHLNIYDFTVPQFIHMFTALSHVLAKASIHPDASTFPTASLYQDMKPLTFQVQTASNMAKLLLVHVAGKEPLEFANDETTFADMQTRIDRTVEYLKTVGKEDFEGKESIEFEFLRQQWTGLRFVNQAVVPNFYFHVTTAYDILRNKGVALEKVDFLYGKRS